MVVPALQAALATGAAAVPHSDTGAIAPPVVPLDHGAGPAARHRHRERLRGGLRPRHEVLSAEQASRHESVIRQRLREARFPEVKTLDTFDFTTAAGVF